MTRVFDPISYDPVNLLRRHAGVSYRHDFEQSFFTAGEHALRVAFDDGRKWLFLLPLRMLGREGLHPIEGERELKIDRLLGPERADVVKGRDALVRRNEIWRVFV